MPIPKYNPAGLDGTVCPHNNMVHIPGKPCCRHHGHMEDNKPHKSQHHKKVYGTGALAITE